VSFNATATAGAATTIALTSGNSQSAAISTALTNPFVVTVTDAGGNPVSGVSVSWSITGTPTGATGQALSSTSTTTDVNGQASTTLTLGNKVGTYTVQASSTGLTGSPISFTATATVGIASQFVKISGDNQSGAVNATLAQPLVVQVTDGGGNPVQGITVSFTFLSTPSGATGQTLTPTSATTNTSGQVQTSLRLGSMAGQYRVRVGSPQMTGVFVVFEATAAGPTSVERLSEQVPTEFSLQQNYPNPFNPSTTISFSLPSKSFVLLQVFDAMGREAAVLLAEELSGGTYSLRWNAEGLPSGVYFYRLQAGPFSQTKKLMLLR
jgi:hypothetical protein